MLCHTSLFIFSLCPHVTFYKTLTSLATFYNRPHRASTTFKVAVSHCVTYFYPCEPYTLLPDDQNIMQLHDDAVGYVYGHFDTENSAFIL